MSAPLGDGAVSRVLMTADAVGGVWQYALELARGFSDRGIQTLLAVLGPRPDPAKMREARKVPRLHLLHTDLPLDWTARSESEVLEVGTTLANLVEDYGADIIHLNSPSLAALGNYSVPVAATAHSCVATWWQAMHAGLPMPDDFQWRTEHTARGIAAADAVIAPTHSFAAALRQTYGLRSNILVVHNGRRPQIGSDGERRRCVLTAGRLWDGAKNVAALDRVAPHLDAPVYAAGPLAGPNGASIELRHVRPLGSLSDLALSRWYRRSPIFVSLSRYEPFGLSVLEAAQSGAALVLSDIPSFRELWDGAALFVRDDDELLTALRELLDAEEHARVLGARARARAARYEASTMVDGTLAIYRLLRLPKARLAM